MEALPGFWEDSDGATKIQKEKSLLSEVTNTHKKVADLFDEFEILTEYAREGDNDSALEALGSFDKMKTALEEAEQKALLSDEMDPNNAILSINAGAGGTESCDWASMIHRMLTRWAESKGFKVEVLDHQYGDSAGIKSVTFTVTGNYAYGLMKSETGIHRLVRISPFDSNARRHTSFCSVFVSPEVDDTIEIEILDKDIRIDVYRSGGAGGQSVNTTDSAVRVTHIPTNTVVANQDQKSQLKNKEKALKILRNRIYDKMLQEHNKEISDERKGLVGTGDRSERIRTYNFPQGRLSDHRIGLTLYSLDKIIEGDLAPVTDALIAHNQATLLKGNED